MTTTYALRGNHGIPGTYYRDREGKFVLTPGGDLKGDSALWCIERESVFGTERERKVSLMSGSVVGTPDYERGVVVFHLRHRERGGGETVLSPDERALRATPDWVADWILATFELPIAPEDMPPQFGGQHVNQLRKDSNFALVLLSVREDGTRTAVALWDDRAKWFVPGKPQTIRKPEGWYRPDITEEQRERAALQGLVLEV